MPAPTVPTSAEARDAALEAVAAVTELRSRPDSDRGDTYERDLRSAVARVHEADTLFNLARSLEADAVQRAAWDEAVRQAEAGELRHPGANGPGAAFAPNGEGHRSIGDQYVESELFRRVAEDGIGALRNGEVEVRNLLTSGDSGVGSNNFVPVGSPFLGNQRRQRFFLRDVIPATQTGLASIPYIRELGALTYEGGASAVSEASAKPEVTMTFERDDAPVRKIAAWVQITEEALADAPTLKGYIDTRLAYMLDVREQALLLTGNGTAPNLKGITSFSGVQTQSAVSNDLPGTIGLAIGAIENVDGEADGVAINTITFWTGVLKRQSTTMDGGYVDAGLPFAGIPSTILGIPAIRTRALATNKAIVGSWGLGAQIFDRMGTTIKATDSHASLFISNTWVVLAEKRLAFAVYRPDFFVDTTLSFT